ncbi:MAG: hypothetical protein ACKPCM_08940 [Pseudanabaena sp.]
MSSDRPINQQQNEITQSSPLPNHNRPIISQKRDHPTTHKKHDRLINPSLKARSPRVV